MLRILSIFAFLVVLPVAVQAECRDESPATLFAWCGCPEPPPGDEPLVTDRPDFTEASSTVGWGAVQVEAGYTYVLDDDGTQTQVHSWGEPLLRLGLFANWFEFRLGVFPLTEVVDTGAARQTNSGTDDLYLGFKIALTPQEGWLPETAVMPQMTVPLGDEVFSDDVVLPGVNFLYGWDLSESWSLAGSTQFNRAVDDTGDLYTAWAQSLATGLSLTDQLGTYAEWFAIFPHNAVDAQTEHYLNGGFTWLANDDVQFDVRAGLGLNDAAEDFFAGAGLSVRYR